MAYSSAYKRFLASVPTAQREYRTIEIFHPQFSGMLRFVQDKELVEFKLEATAPRGSRTIASFFPLSMEIKEPGETDQLDSALLVRLGAVGGEVFSELNRINGSGFFTPIEVIYRKYYSGSLANPMIVMYLSAKNIVFEGYSTIMFNAEDLDLSNTQAGEFYLLSRFPQLANV